MNRRDPYNGARSGAYRSGRRQEASYDEASYSRARRRRRAGTPVPQVDGPFKILGIAAAVVLALVAARLVWIQVVDGPRLADRAENRRTNSVVLHAKRGTIYDRNGNVLAISVDCDTVVCDPTVVSWNGYTGDAATDGAAEAVADIMADVLGGDSSDYLAGLTKQGTQYVRLAERVDASVADELASRLKAASKDTKKDADGNPVRSGLNGVFYESDTKRVYPYGTTAAQLLGYVNSDGAALSGLEYYYNDVLSGTDGSRLYEAGASGSPIAGGASETFAAKNGTDIVLSIDIDLQEECESIISEASKTYEAESGSVMVTDPKTGEIYAAASTPLPDFSNITDASSLNLKLVSDSYEPGSVFKVLTTSIGIEDGLLTKDTTFNIPAEILVGDDVVHDDDMRDYAMDMSVEYAMAQSSNVAMAYYVQNVIGSERFAQGVEKFGIGQRTGIDFPGEAQGIVKGYDQYDGSTAGSMAFGQSLAIPLVQIVRAYGAVANGGVPNTPHFLVSKAGDEVDWPSGSQIVSAETCDEEIDMMRAVMTEGSGKNGAIDGYDIAGKTGTGEQADEQGGYKANHYVASLCGFANADDPQALVYVGLNGIPYLAAESAAVVFHDVMEQSVTILGISPAKTAD